MKHLYLAILVTVASVGSSPPRAGERNGDTTSFEDGTSELGVLKEEVSEEDTTPTQIGTTIRVSAYNVSGYGFGWKTIHGDRTHPKWLTRRH